MTRRLLGEAAAVVAAGALAFALGAPAPGVVVTVLAVAALAALGHLIPDSDETAWPRLPAPERGGRRAEVYRLSWQTGRDGAAASGAVLRLRQAIALRRRSAAPEEAEELDRLAGQLDRREGAAVQRVLEDLEAMARRDGASPRPDGPRGSAR